MQMASHRPHVHSENTSSWMPWFICFLASLFFFYEFIQGNMFASIADDIMRDFHIKADKMTYLSSIYYLSNVIFLFVAGFLLDRFSAKKVILIAMLLCVISTFVLAYAHDYYLALFCRFVTGIGSAFCFLGPIRIASLWFPPQRMALVTGAIVTMAMSGGLLAQYPMTTLVMHLGWRSALMVIGWLGMGMWLMMLVGIKEKSHHRMQTQPIRARAMAKLAYGNAQTLAAALYTSLMNMGVAVFGALMGALYLIQRLEVSKPEAAMVNAMLFLGAIIGGPLIGWFSDHIERRILPMKLGVLASLLIVLLILYAPVQLHLMMFLFFCLGFFTAAQVISYAFVVERCEPWMTATAVSVVSILTQGGYIVYQNLFSYLLTIHGDQQIQHGIPMYSLTDYQFAARILPLGLVVALCLVWRLKETHAKHVV